MTIPFAFIMALSVATTHMSAWTNRNYPECRHCNNNVLCYTRIEQEKEVKVPGQDYKSIQMLEKTDLHNKTISALRNETISAITSAEARKRA
jgi:hypothetical protein